jgi:hypothetical protein
MRGDSVANGRPTNGSRGRLHRRHVVFRGKRRAAFAAQLMPTVIRYADCQY